MPSFIPPQAVKSLFRETVVPGLQITKSANKVIGCGSTLEVALCDSRTQDTFATLKQQGIYSKIGWDKEESRPYIRYTSKDARKSKRYHFPAEATTKSVKDFKSHIRKVLNNPWRFRFPDAFAESDIMGPNSTSRNAFAESGTVSPASTSRESIIVTGPYRECEIGRGSNGEIVLVKPQSSATHSPTAPKWSVITEPASPPPPPPSRKPVTERTKNAVTPQSKDPYPLRDHYEERYASPFAYDHGRPSRGRRLGEMIHGSGSKCPAEVPVTKQPHSTKPTPDHELTPKHHPSQGTALSPTLQKAQLTESIETLRRTTGIYESMPDRNDSQEKLYKAARAALNKQELALRRLKRKEKTTKDLPDLPKHQSGETTPTLVGTPSPSASTSSFQTSVSQQIPESGSTSTTGLRIKRKDIGTGDLRSLKSKSATSSTATFATAPESNSNSASTHFSMPAEPKTSSRNTSVRSTRDLFGTEAEVIPTIKLTKPKHHSRNGFRHMINTILSVTDPITP